MGLFQNLCRIYDVLAEQKAEDLLPIGFSKQNVHIECLLFAKNGDVRLDEVEVIKKEDMQTILPVTEESAGRTSKPVAHPLFDKLCYISKDYIRYCDDTQYNQRQMADREKMYGLYQKELEDFLASVQEDQGAKVDYDAKKVTEFLSILYQYLTQKDIIQDLAKKSILSITEGKLKAEKSEEKSKEKSALLKILPKDDQGEAMVRFTIQREIDDERYEIWKDIDVWKAYLSYLSKKEGKKDWCVITGEYTKITEKHPKYIRMPGDGAKLISSNDAINYTYRGRFHDSSEPNAISYLASEKMHSALKYLIQHQGFKIEDKVFLHFHSNYEAIPKLDLSEINEELYQEEKITSRERLDLTKEVVANRIHKAMQGRGKKYDFSETITSLILDAATPGRLSVLYYNELPYNMFFERIKLWHERSAWENRFFLKREDNQENEEKSAKKGESVLLTRAPTLWSLVLATVGEKADNKLKKEVYQRILVSIIQGQAIPKDLMLMSVRRASQPMGMDYFDWDNQMRIACSLYRNYYWQKEDYTMELDTQRTNRSYLYGRLLALADKIERDAIYTKGEDSGGDKRPTNAWRYMVAFSHHPYRTWNIIYNAINPYMMQLEQKRPAKATFYRNEMASIYALFEEKDYESNQSLEGSYLMGFFCQSSKLWEKTEKLNSGSNVIEAND